MARVTPAHARRTGWSSAAHACTWALVLLLWASGLALYLWPAEALMQLGPVPTLARRSALIAHGGGAWIACLFAGRWIWPHAQMVWRRRVGWTWIAGCALALMLLVIAGTGLLLLYGPADSHDGASALHWWVALGLPALLGLHAWRRLRLRALRPSE